MNEIALEHPAQVGLGAPAESQATPRKHATTPQWYLLLTLVIIFGWLVRDYSPITPKDGTGYWLGIIGGTLMLALLLYPVRKRVRLLYRLGDTRHWFRLHMLLGLIGPLLVLYHCNFRLGSINSQVALYCMLLVAGSGVIGRHFYARIHRGLYGRKTSLRELQGELAASLEKGHGLAKLMPNLVTQLDSHAAQLQGCEVLQSLGVGRSLRWTFTHHFTRLKMLFIAYRELGARAKVSPVVARNRRRIWRTTSRYVRDYTNLMGRVAQFSFYERLFALWHVLHLPIFFAMILSGVVHVLAVHMY